MTAPNMHDKLLEAVAFAGANSRAYLSALFQAHRERRIVATMPLGFSPLEAQKNAIPGVRLIEHRAFEPDPGWFSETQTPIFSDDPAQIVFSSGTTGRPKAILLPHRALADVVRRLNEAMEVTADIREYVGVPVNFSFGFARVRAVAAARGRSFLPVHGFNPVELAAMLRKGEVNAVSAVPTLWRIALQNPAVFQGVGDAVRWIEIGSQYMSKEEKEALKALFPRAKILQHYGMTEASRSTFLDISSTDGAALESVGRAFGDSEVKLSEGGRIMVRGPHVALGVLSDGGVTPVIDKDGWLLTNDFGEISGGDLYFRGRADDLINCSGIKVDPEQFERRLSEPLRTLGAEVAISSQKDPLRGDRILVAYKAGKTIDLSGLRDAVLAAGESVGVTGAGAFVFAPVEEVPRTPTGKVKRKELAALAQGAAAPIAPGPSTPVAVSGAPLDGAATASGAQRRALIKAWEDALGVSPIALNESFFDLGGDSLSAISVMIRMENLGVDREIAKGIFDGRTLGDILGVKAAVAAPPVSNTNGSEEASSSGLTIANAVNAINATRGVLVAWVLFVHWAPGLFARIDDRLVTFYSDINLLLRFGTPGFALVFGLGLGALRLHQFRRNPARFDKTVRRNALILMAGVALLSAFRALRLWTEGALGNPIALSNTFYSVLTFYLLLVVCEGIIVRMAAGRRISDSRVTFMLLALAVGALVIHEALYRLLGDAQTVGLIDLIRLQLIAKYGFFKMAAPVLLGAAIGWHFRQNFMRADILSGYAQAGLALTAFGALLVMKAQPPALTWNADIVQPWHLLMYGGFVLLLLAGFGGLCRGMAAAPQGPASRVLRHMLNLSIVTGMLALPIFVGHEIVLPIKDILESFGAPNLVALSISLGLFLAPLGYGYLRFMHLLAR